MPWSFRLLLASILVGGVILAVLGLPFGRDDEGPIDPLEAWQRFPVHDPNRVPPRLATNPGTPWGDYVGSKACQRCHEEDYDKWRHSFHSRTLYDATEESVFGQFEGEQRYEDPDHPIVVDPFMREDPVSGRKRFYMKLAWRRDEHGNPISKRRRDTYGVGFLPDIEKHDTVEVIYAFGNRRHQPYVARWPDGKHWVLPVFWNDVTRSWEYSGFRSYVDNCAVCHVTGIKTSPTPYHPEQGFLPMTFPGLYNLAPDKEGWADGAVGCENCHGPGRHHIEAVEATGIEAYRAQRKAGEKEPTIFPCTEESASLELRTNLCGQCHNFFTESSCTWTPSPDGLPKGADGKPRLPNRKPLRPSKDLLAWQFYEDGSHKSPCSVVEEYSHSAMYKHGEIGCSDCHDPHGTDNWADLLAPIENNQLCIGCHEEYASIEAQVAHSKHGKDSPGNRCVECHMPRHLVFTNGIHLMSDRIFRHSFSIPTGERRPGGPPSSCNVCHQSQDHTWTQDQIQKLWGRRNEGALPKLFFDPEQDWGPQHNK